MTTKPTILIVDDQPMGREVLRALLMKEGYNLAFAENGHQALAQAEALNPDLVLLDVMMPDIDGFEVCRRVRANPTIAEMPIIMVTALDDRESRLSGIEAGADDFVTKPFDRVELRSRVKTITRLNRYRSLTMERNKFEWVVDETDDGYLIVGRKGQIQYINRQARLFLGLPDDDSPVTQTFQAAIKDKYRLEPQQAWQQNAWQNKEMARYLVRPETDTSHAFWVQVESLPSESDWVLRLRDVTKQMEIARDVWQFNGMVSHKLRTPLIHILGGMDMLVSHINRLQQGDVLAIAERALKASQRLNETINDILRYSNSSAMFPGEEKSLPHANYDSLEALVDAIATDLEISTITVENDIPNLLARLPISGPRLEVILRELCQNAHKFHPTQTPAITISTAQKSAGLLTINVADDGITLSPEQLSQAWTPYYQGEKYFTGESSGMGLGLSLVASSVWNVGGNCKIHNQPAGSGVIISLDFPLGTQQGS